LILASSFASARLLAAVLLAVLLLAMLLVAVVVVPIARLPVPNGSSIVSVFDRMNVRSNKDPIVFISQGSDTFPQRSNRCLI